MRPAESPHSPSAGAFVRTLIPVWLVTAAWDALCATALSVFAYGSTAAQLWQGVAATALGPASANGGTRSTASGLLVHAGVAFAWSALFVAAVYVFPALRSAIRTRGGALAVAAAYGPVIWLAMSLAIIPLATGRPARITARWWVQVFAHLPFVTLPLVFTTRRMLQPRENAHVE